MLPHFSFTVLSPRDAQERFILMWFYPMNEAHHWPPDQITPHQHDDLAHGYLYIFEPSHRYTVHHDSSHAGTFLLLVSKQRILK